ncbi:hypothetical protein ONZ45_g7704 [Pleurotus djamor]|nr:hypothetical protein ONZ45_g7704 [Pleurotus djamor]
MDSQETLVLPVFKNHDENSRRLETLDAPQVPLPTEVSTLLYFSHDDVTSTTISSYNLESNTTRDLYLVERRKDTSTTVSRMSNSTPQPVAVIKKGALLGDKITFGGDESKSLRVGKWLRKVKALSPFPVLFEANGKSYTWTVNEIHQLFLYESTDLKTPIAWFKRAGDSQRSSREPSDASSSIAFPFPPSYSRIDPLPISAYLILEPRALPVQDLVVTSFLILEDNLRTHMEQEEDKRCCYLFFKRFEPTHPLIHLVSFIGVPLAWSILVRDPSQQSSTSVVRTIGYYLGTLVISVLSYRLSPLHPLARYPGPVLYKATRWWPALVCLSGKQHLRYEELHRQYGNVVRVGPNELSIIDPEAINPLMGASELPKGPCWIGRQADMESHSLPGVQTIEEHSRRRKPWNRAMSTAAVKDYQAVLVKRVRQLASTLAKQRGSVDLSLWINRFTYDFMSDMGFGGGSEMMRDGDKEGLLKLLSNGLLQGVFLGHLPWLSPYYLLLPYNKGLRAFRQFAARMAMLRKTEGAKTKDVFYYLNNEDGRDKVSPSVAEVASGGALVIVAGSDTTATTLSNIFYFLVSQPRTCARLLEEIVQFFPQGEDCLNPSVHVKMPYLNAVINEALRLFPAVPSGSQRINSSTSEPRLVGKYEVPPGTSVIMPHYVMHRDPQRFSPFPDVFLPERWLPREMQAKLEPEIYAQGGSDSHLIRHDTSGFIPFSYGPSNCAGKNLAYQEMRMVVCLLLKTFRMEFSSKHHKENAAWVEDLNDHFILVKGSLMVDLSLRGEALLS